MTGEIQALAWNMDKLCGFKLVNGIPTLPLIIESPTAKLHSRFTQKDHILK
jgi:hypothetical protein